eukprot:GHVQ01012729.1.p1 GENE.GHVQ01012729.1~~GHVQ01012729.1.p1  ORF type:complete len:168 (+),score=11.91 GHVQ01012729.1:240-743(+)
MLSTMADLPIPKSRLMKLRAVGLFLVILVQSSFCLTPFITPVAAYGPFPGLDLDVATPAWMTAMVWLEGKYNIFVKREDKFENYPKADPFDLAVVSMVMGLGWSFWEMAPRFGWKYFAVMLLPVVLFVRFFGKNVKDALSLAKVNASKSVSDAKLFLTTQAEIAGFC